MKAKCTQKSPHKSALSVSRSPDAQVTGRVWNHGRREEGRDARVGEKEKTPPASPPFALPEGWSLRGPQQAGPAPGQACPGRGWQAGDRRFLPASFGVMPSQSGSRGDALSGRRREKGVQEWPGPPNSPKEEEPVSQLRQQASEAETEGGRVDQSLHHECPRGRRCEVRKPLLLHERPPLPSEDRRLAKGCLHSKTWVKDRAFKKGELA